MSSQKPPRISEDLIESGLFSFVRKPQFGVCPVNFCTNNSAPGGRYSGLCWKHFKRFNRKRHYRRDAYNDLKQNAKKRGIKFTITLEYFLGLTDAFCFWDMGEAAVDRGDILTIDRADACKGYEPGNLSILTQSENTAKGNRERFLPQHVQAMLQRDREKKQAELAEYAHHIEPGKVEHPF